MENLTLANTSLCCSCNSSISDAKCWMVSSFISAYTKSNRHIFAILCLGSRWIKLDDCVLKRPGKETYLVLLLIPITLKRRHLEVKFPYGVFVMLELRNRSAQVTYLYRNYFYIVILSHFIQSATKIGEEWWRQKKASIHNGGWHWTLNLPHVSSCEMLHFVTSYMNQNKDVNKLE